MKFKIGDRVIVQPTDIEYVETIRRWIDKSTVLLVTNVDRVNGCCACWTEVRLRDRTNLYIYNSDLQHAPKQTNKKKYPDNAITRMQALALAKKIHPKVTHIAYDSNIGGWHVGEGVMGMNGVCYGFSMHYWISVPIKYNGTWQDSIYPKVYFSKPKGFKGFEYDVTVKADGALIVGCTTIPNSTIDEIIKHRTTELKKFPSNKSKKKR